MHHYELEPFLRRQGGDWEGVKAILDLLPPLDLEAGPWLAGGLLRRALKKQPLDSDVDLFFRSEEQLKGYQLALQAKNAVEIGNRDTVLTLRVPLNTTETCKAIKVQLIRLYQPDLASVLDQFDFTICQFGTDGRTLLVGTYTLWDTARGRLALHRLSFGVSTLRRMFKYQQQGFYACPGTCQELLERIAQNPGLINETIVSLD